MKNINRKKNRKALSSSLIRRLVLCSALALTVALGLSWKPARVAHAATIVNSGPDTDAANNDYRRIQNALNAAASGDTIILSGTFDFTAPFAAAAWALGNDNTASTADDYEVLVPAGLSNVTLTASSLGSATIQGPGDLAAVNLEAFLVFDSALSGASQGWTISNLRILDFDLSIGMFAAGVSDYNGTTIQNNFIRIATDLNATVAPADTNQNIGIHYSFGANQSILGNSFQVPGDGVSDTGAGNFSSTVVMQSTTSGGNVYDGLNISNNVVHVLNAQSANPQVLLGIWENGHAHTSNITISGNSFINDAAGNSPSLNLQRGFRVTSHSSATTTVSYQNNSVSGANIGFQWIAGSNFAGKQAVKLTGNTLTNNDTGVLVQSNGVAHLETNVITGSGSGAGIHVLTGTLTASGANTNSIYRNVVSGGSGDGIWIEATAGASAPITQNDLSGNTGFGVLSQIAPLITAESNWWGNNLAANVAAKVSGNVDFDPWLASGTDLNAAVGFQPFTYATTSGTITTFVGTSAADTGALLAGDPITMQMDGDTATTAAAQLLNFDIQLLGSDDVFTLGQTGIPTIFDGGPGNDTLVGTNVAQTWNINGAGSGNIPGATSSFTNVEALRGGTAADSFVFGAAGSIAQTVDGNLGIDTLDNSAISGHVISRTGPGTLDGYQGTATGIGSGFDNIDIPSPAIVSATKTVTGTFAPGGAITYTVVLSNSSVYPQLDNSGDEFTDILPSSLALTDAAATSGTALANIGARTVTWNGVIPGNGSVTITITAIIDNGIDVQAISNQGSASYDADGNGVNEVTVLTDDPGVGGASDPTVFKICPLNGVVTTNADGGPGSLRQMIQDVCPGSTITFDMNQVVSPITLTSGELLINKDLTIQGPDANLLTIARGTAIPDFHIFGISSANTVVISGLTLTNGAGTAGPTSDGGGIFNKGTLTLQDSVVTGNTASNGGGIYNQATLTISNTTISNNHADTGAGGGVYHGGSLLTINNSTISGNSGFRTAGLEVNGGAANLTNSTVSGNSALGDGGGINVLGGNATLINVTVTNNHSDSDNNGAGDGGGIRGSINTSLRNTIVAGNFKGPGTSTPHDIFLTVDSQSSFNLIGTGGSGGLTNGVNNNHVGIVDALLAPLANHGGPTQTHALLYNSPALENGANCVVLPAGNGGCLETPLTTDQRGAGFVRQIGSFVDIGAYERESPETRVVPSGTNVKVDLADARLTFPCTGDDCNVRGPSTTKQTNDPAVLTNAAITVIDANAQGPPPPGYIIGTVSNPALPAFDVSTTATYNGPVTICFYLPSITNASFFETLKVLHKEGGVLVDPGSTVHMAAKLVCTTVNSFSPFVIAHTAAPTAASASISGAIRDSQGNPVAGTVVRLGGTQTRKTITDSDGNYRFGNVDTNGFYTVTPSRVNYNFSPFNRSFSQLGNKTEAVFGGTFTGDALNPLDTAEYFVRQQYVDVLGREPDEEGFNFWSDRILVCGNDAECIRSQRIAVAAQFFIAQEFQQSGSFIYNLYEGALDRRPDFSEYALDRRSVVGGSQLDVAKQAFAESFVQRSEFTTKYQANTTAESFVDALLTNLRQSSGVDLGSQRDNLIAHYQAGSSQIQSRSYVLREVTENQATRDMNYNSGFVLTEYFSYLQRNADRGGYDYWLSVLNGSGGGSAGNDRGMVCSFITSTEYQQRFSAIVSRSNGECGQ